MPNLLDRQAAATILGISTVSIDRLRRSGNLPYRKFGKLIRFLPEDLDKFIASSEAGGSAATNKN